MLSLAFLLCVIHPIWSSITPNFGKNVWQRRIDDSLPLTKCITENQKVMDRCVDDAFDSWRYYHKLDYESDRQLVKASCCAMWDARDCQLKAARKLCSSDAVGELYMAWEEGILSWSQSNECWDYRFSYNSANCKLADWAIALIVVGGILVICLVVFAVIKCCRMRNRRKTIVFNSVNYNRP